MISRRDFLKLSSAALLATSLPRLDLSNPDETTNAPLIWGGSTKHHYVALTYDDCNWLDRMHDIEKLLEGYPDFRISLFPTGENIVSKEAQDPGIWKRFYDKGHDIGYHSWNHTSFAVMSRETALKDFDRWMDAYVNAMGFRPEVRFSRPTYGVLSPSFDNLCTQRGLVGVMWSAAGGGETSFVMNDTFHKIRNGDIVLFHFRLDGVNTSREAYPYLKQHGIGAVTLSKLYDDLLIEQNQSDGCDVNSASSLTRTCIE
jgi:peptidoglycan/xylan/chitin deacetylase (PgdA/CDA1 family)